MAFGVDYASSGGNATALKYAGATFVCRYLSGGGGKDITAFERDRLLAAGLGIVLVWETDGRTGPLAGAAGGLADGPAAVKQARALGAPAGTCLYFAVDFDMRPGNLSAVRAYFSALRRLIVPYRLGDYGGFATIEGVHDIVDCGWQTYAWSGGRWSVHAQIQQYLNGQSFTGITVDFDRSMTADFGQWGTTGGDQEIMTNELATYYATLSWQSALGRVDAAGLAASATRILADGQPLAELYRLQSSAEGVAYSNAGSLASRLASAGKAGPPGPPGPPGGVAPFTATITPK